MALDPPPDGAGATGAGWTYDAARLHLARLTLADGAPLRDVLRHVTDVAAATLQVERVSIWMFLDGGRAIRCDFLHHPAARQVYEGAVLAASDFPTYFDALAARRVISVRVGDDDRLTREFRDAYFRPLGITAMLDAPIYREGRVVGIACHEQIGRERAWSPPEHDFAAAVAETISRLYAEDARARAELRLHAFETQAQERRRVESLGRLAVGMAHDFRNLLMLIDGYAELIGDAARDDAAVTGLVHDLRTASERATNLTHDLLRLGNSETGRPGIVDVGALIERSRGLLGAVVGPERTFEVAVAPSVSRVLVDPVQLERVIMNLVANARDATPPGGSIRITVREVSGALDLQPDQTLVAVDVQDTGHGMDEATLRQVFEPFFTTKGEAGTGLGLAIVQQIVTAAGGFVEVDSAPGRGTRVSFYLPRIAAPA